MNKLKKLSALLLAAALCLSLLPAAAAEEKEKTLVIGSEEDFVAFAQNCTRDVWSKGLRVELSANLDLSGRQNVIVPYFRGHFDGRGHTIKGIEISEKGSKLGLFRTLTEQAVVENLTVSGHVTAQGSAESVGLLAGENSGIIRNCWVKGSVSASKNTGGLVGVNLEKGRIEDSVSEVHVQGVTQTGGAAGLNLGTLADCSNRGPVNTDENQKPSMSTGGLAGKSEGLITGCSNSAAVGIAHLGYNSGGIAGLQTGEIRECSNTGEIRGRKDVGGISGQIEPDSNIKSKPSPLDAVDRNMNDFIGQTQEYSNRLSEMAERGTAGGRVINDSLAGIHSTTDKAGDNFSKDLKEINQKLKDSGNSLTELTDTLREIVENYSKDWSDESRKTFDSVGGEVDRIQGELNRMLENLNRDSDVLKEISGRMNTSLHGLRSGIRQLGEKPELTLQDDSAKMNGGPGFLGECTNSGEIRGDANVGGIAGVISVEIQDEPETDLELDEVELLADTTIHVRAVIKNSRSEGEVSAKNECAGGILGRSELGAVTDCVTKGKVSAGGNYCGGIAGRMRGSIIDSSALADLDGQGWQGGIAGWCRDVSGCVAMTRVEEKGESCGAIAGESDGNLEDNFYLQEDLAGLDGVDYEGKAQGLSFAEFSALEQVPDDFLEFSYRFVVDGHPVKEIPFEYGSDLDMNLIPPYPEENGRFGYWPEYPTENLQRSMVLEANFDEPDATLAWGGEVPELLAEGLFTHSAALSATEEELPELNPEMGKARKAIRYEVTGSREEKVTLRLRAGELKRPAVAVLTGSEWLPADAQTDGSYLVLEAGLTGEILLYEEPATLPVLSVLAISAVAVILLLLLARRAKKKKQ